MGVRTLLATLSAAAAAAFIFAPTAVGGGWLPRADGAEWTYEWSNSVYSAAPAKEKVTVKSQAARSFTLAWTTEELGNAPEAPISIGTIAFQETNAGLVNETWASTFPPPEFPILCSRTVGCNNSLASTYYLLIWGSRAPVLPEPLLRGAAWAGAGGADGTVASVSRYLGREQISVPAFPTPVVAARVRTDITHAGALGDPYGSGVRTVWWVHGVGPVKIVFEHAGGTGAPVTTSVLQSTNQTPTAAPSDLNYFPYEKGTKLRYRWTNAKHLRQPSVQQFEVEEVANGSARFGVSHVSGPIRVAGSYGFATRADGVTNIWGFTKAASLAKFPALGPKALPANQRRRFFTPFDLMTFGWNPILPAYPGASDTWKAAVPSRDFSIFGVTGSSAILGVRTVRVPAGTFAALAVRSRLVQPGFPFGSGTRTSYFAPGKGLVKLVFAHGDRSTSTVELLR